MGGADYNSQTGQLFRSALRASHDTLARKVTTNGSGGPTPVRAANSLTLLSNLNPEQLAAGRAIRIPVDGPARAVVTRVPLHARIIAPLVAPG